MHFHHPDLHQNGVSGTWPVCGLTDRLELFAYWWEGNKVTTYPFLPSSLAVVAVVYAEPSRDICEVHKVKKCRSE